MIWCTIAPNAHRIRYQWRAIGDVPQYENWHRGQLHSVLFACLTPLTVRSANKERPSAAHPPRKVSPARKCKNIQAIKSLPTSLSYFLQTEYFWVMSLEYVRKHCVSRSNLKARKSRLQKKMNCQNKFSILKKIFSCLCPFLMRHVSFMFISWYLLHS